MTRQRAYSYIRRDVAGIHLDRYEHELRALAKLRLDLSRTIIDGPAGLGMRQLLELLSAPDAPDTTVLLPSLDHIPDTMLDDLTRYAHVETVTPRQRWPKRREGNDHVLFVPSRPRHEVSQETRSVPAVASLRQALADAQRQFRDEVNR